MADPLLTLFLYILGSNSAPTSVEIDKSKTVDDLKKAICADDPQSFNGINARELKLYKVELDSDGNLEETAQNGISNSKEMNPAYELSEFFVNGVAPKKKIHVVVKLPDLPSSSKRRRTSSLSESNWTKRKRPVIKSIAGTIYETEPIDPSDRNKYLPSQVGLEWLMKTPNLIASDKSHYIELLEKRWSNFRAMYLRPRRWGKSTFLQLLVLYYDIKNKDQFADLFGGLYIGKNPTRNQTSLLVLTFDFSRVRVMPTAEATAEKFDEYVNQVLIFFLECYEDYLGAPAVSRIINWKDGSHSLNRVLKLVREKGYELFVGIDEYDSPINTAVLNPGQNIEPAVLVGIFYSFFSVLKAADVVKHYWVTGILPVFREATSPLIVQIISDDPKFHGICGLTAAEVTTITKTYLSDSNFTEAQINAAVRQLKNLYNGYCFSQNMHDPELTLFNPLLVFEHLRGIKDPVSARAFMEHHAALQITRVLDALPNEGDRSIFDTFDRCVNGRMETRPVMQFGPTELANLGPREDILLSLLFYLGLLTFDPDPLSFGKLKVSNLVMKNFFLQRLLPLVKPSIDSTGVVPLDVYKGLCEGNTKPFRRILEVLMSKQPTRAVKDWTEPTFRSVIVTIFHDVPSCPPCFPELSLIADPFKPPTEGRSAFLDIFFPGGAHVPCIELKNVTLESLYRGQLEPAKQDEELTSDIPLDKFRKDFLQIEDSDQLLSRKVYVRKFGMPPFKTCVSEVLKNAEEQVRKYLAIIAKGAAGGNRAGVNDMRVSCGAGVAELIGYAAVCVGGTKLCVVEVETRKTEFAYGHLD